MGEANNKKESRITFRGIFNLISIKTRFYLAFRERNEKKNHFLVSNKFGTRKRAKNRMPWHWESVDFGPRSETCCCPKEKKILCNYNSFSRFSCQGGFRCCCLLMNVISCFSILRCLWFLFAVLRSIHARVCCFFFRCFAARCSNGAVNKLFRNVFSCLF